MIQVNWNPSARELRVFSLLFLILFGVIGYLVQNALPRLAVSFWGLGILVFMVGLIRPSSVRLVYVIWMGLAFPIGFVISNLILATVFYVIVTPIGFLQRLRGWDPLSQNKKSREASGWILRSTPENKVRYFRQY